MAKVYYNKLLKGSITDPASYTFDQVPDKYKAQVKAMADADFEDEKLPQWQYNKMFGINEEREV